MSSYETGEGEQPNKFLYPALFLMTGGFISMVLSAERFCDLAYQMPAYQGGLFALMNGVLTSILVKLAQAAKPREYDECRRRRDDRWRTVDPRSLGRLPIIPGRTPAR